MAQYFLAYRDGKKLDTREEEMAQMARWKAWIEELGSAMINPGTPMGQTRTVSADGVSEGGAGMMGYSIVEADNMDAAVAIARACPFMEIGSIAVTELMEMKM
ncbi:MAG: YciI family protein [Alphaproteobacteria bacterium]